MTDSILEAIKNRRSIGRFGSTPIEEGHMTTILEAGRWAPSWLNRQPWTFIVVTRDKIRERMSEVVPTAFRQGIREAPACIVVAVDTNEDPYHFIEDGAIASENMALAASGVGLHSAWIGLFDLARKKDSPEAKVRAILEIPETHRVISILPVGYARKDVPVRRTERKPLHEIVCHEKYGSVRS